MKTIEFLIYIAVLLGNNASSLPTFAETYHNGLMNEATSDLGFQWATNQGAVTKRALNLRGTFNHRAHANLLDTDMRDAGEYETPAVDGAWLGDMIESCIVSPEDSHCPSRPNPGGSDLYTGPHSMENDRLLSPHSRLHETRADFDMFDSDFCPTRSDDDIVSTPCLSATSTFYEDSKVTQALSRRNLFRPPVQDAVVKVEDMPQTRGSYMVPIEAFPVPTKPPTSDHDVFGGLGLVNYPDKMPSVVTRSKSTTTGKRSRHQGESPALKKTRFDLSGNMFQLSSEPAALFPGSDYLGGELGIGPGCFTPLSCDNNDMLGGLSNAHDKASDLWNKMVSTNPRRGHSVLNLQPLDLVIKRTARVRPKLTNALPSIPEFATLEANAEFMNPRLSSFNAKSSPRDQKCSNLGDATTAQAEVAEGRRIMERMGAILGTHDNLETPKKVREAIKRHGEVSAAARIHNAVS